MRQYFYFILNIVLFDFHLVWRVTLWEFNSEYEKKNKRIGRNWSMIEGIVASAAGNKIKREENAFIKCCFTLLEDGINSVHC